jgi:CheY-like chemotaxis protein
MAPAKRRILCAEPREDTCQKIKTLLGMDRHELVSARTVRECLELARSERFDLYMLDGDYADGTSIDLCRKLRSLTPETPVLFFSARTLPHEPQQAFEAAAAGDARPDIFEIVQTVNSILAPMSAGTLNRGDQP